MQLLPNRALVKEISGLGSYKKDSSFRNVKVYRKHFLHKLDFFPSAAAGC